MMTSSINGMVKEVFHELAHALETGRLGKRVTIGLTCDGSEHGHSVMFEAASLAKQMDLFDIVLITTQVDPDFKCVQVADECEMHKVMEELLNDQTIQGCVTLHYNFPIGVSTVGKVVTPAFGKSMYIATTTGTSSTHRIEAMVKNTIAGIVAAKASGIENPCVGILNVEGANSVERALYKLKENGYPISFASSMRSDGGSVMRGNDLLTGHVDVMVCDSLTGNILMKLFSAYNTGGNYEALGFGYGPGIGDKYDHNICIVSRASGAQVIANAMLYAYQLASGNLASVSCQEYKLAKEAKLVSICESLTKKQEKVEETIKAPAQEIVTETISGIDVTELEDAVLLLWKDGIYAESGMGCTGPIILVSSANYEKAIKIIKDANLN